LKANLPKWEFRATNVHYLGFRYTPEDSLPGVKKLKEVKDNKARISNGEKGQCQTKF
jgi:hypothetical protein